MNVITIIVITIVIISMMIIIITNDDHPMKVDLILVVLFLSVIIWTTGAVVSNLFDYLSLYTFFSSSVFSFFFSSYFFEGVFLIREVGVLWCTLLLLRYSHHNWYISSTFIYILHYHIYLPVSNISSTITTIYLLTQDIVWHNISCTTIYLPLGIFSTTIYISPKIYFLPQYISFHNIFFATNIFHSHIYLTISFPVALLLQKLLTTICIGGVHS